MNFPRFWAIGRVSSEGRRGHTFESWGWSNTSIQEAQQRGDENARKVAERFARMGRIDHKRYYGDRPFREEILETINGTNGASAALITRNSYGCRVLNTSGLMFIDVDLNEGPDDSDASWWSEILSSRRETSPPKDQPEIIGRARAWAEANPGWGWRVYRTRAGLRFVATHDFFDPQTMAGSSLFDTLTADALYRKLCQNQKCFRARLTPKPWRCGVHPFKGQWPWVSPKDEKRYLDWEKRYEKAAAKFSTCDLIAKLGNTELHPEIAPIIQVHDSKSGVGSGRPLA